MTINAQRSTKTGLVSALVVGLVLRLTWLSAVGGVTSFVEAGEATRVALSLSAGNGFSDAFFAGQGPTAHILPVTTWIAGVIFWVLGPKTVAANLTLLVLALAQTLAAYLLLRRLFEKLGADPAALRLGMGLLCIIPIYVAQETVDFRYWEGALALCLAVSNLVFLLNLQEQLAPKRGDLVFIASLSAVTFFVSPPAGLAIYVSWASFAIRHFAIRDVGRLALLGAAALALLVAPWALRNEQQLGSPVLLRSNFGLELAIGNYPGALTQPPSAEVLTQRLNAIHPYHSAVAANALRAAGGEVPYAKALGVQTERWIKNNPGAFVELCLRHYAEFFFPRPWQMNFTEWFAFKDARAAIFTTIDAFGLMGLLVGLLQRRRGYGALGLYILLAALPYALVQPVPRYTYLVYGLLVFLAAQLIVVSVRYVIQRLSPPRVRSLA